MITNLKISNVKGLSKEIKLTPFTAVIGQNYSGKTAVLDAVRLALIGYVPALGMQNSSTYQLASGDTMGVQAELDLAGTKRQITRSWASTKSGSIKGASTGIDGWYYPNHILDIGVFLQAPKKAKIKMILGAAGESAGLAADTQASLGKNIGSLDELESHIASLTAQAKDLKVQIKTYEGTVVGTSELDAEASVINYDPAEYQAARSAHDESFAELYQAEATLLQLSTAAMRAIELRAELSEISDPPAEPFAIAELQAQLAEANKRHAENMVHLSSLRAEHKTNQEIYKRALSEYDYAAGGKTPEEVREQLAKLPAGSGEIVDLYALAANGQKANGDALLAKSKLENETKRRDVVLSQLREMAELDCCPTCGAAEQGWRAKIEVTLQSSVEMAEDAVHDAQQAYWLAQKHADDATAKYNSAYTANSERILREGLQTALAAWADVEKYKALVAAGINESEQAQIETMSSSRIVELTHQIEAQQKQAAARAEHDKMLAEIAAAPTEAELNKAEQAVEAARAKRVQTADAFNFVIQRKKQHDQESERLANVAESRKRLDDSVEKLAGINTLIKNAQAILNAKAQELWGPIEHIGTYFNAMLKIKIAMHDGEIGAYHGGQFVPFEALSGTEQLVAACCVQLGLAGNAPIKLLALDELSRMTEENKSAFNEALIKLRVAGLLDQVILCDYAKKFWDVEAAYFAEERNNPDWSVVEIG